MGKAHLFLLVTQAYLDPGTGSMILQGIIAALLAVGATMGAYWQRIKSFFKKEKDHNDDE